MEQFLFTKLVDLNLWQVSFVLLGYWFVKELLEVLSRVGGILIMEWAERRRKKK